MFPTKNWSVISDSSVSLWPVEVLKNALINWEQHKETRWACCRLWCWSVMILNIWSDLIPAAVIHLELMCITYIHITWVIVLVWSQFTVRSTLSCRLCGWMLFVQQAGSEGELCQADSLGSAGSSSTLASSVIEVEAERPEPGLTLRTNQEEEVADWLMRIISHWFTDSWTQSEGETVYETCLTLMVFCVWTRRKMKRRSWPPSVLLPPCPSQRRSWSSSTRAEPGRDSPPSTPTHRWDEMHSAAKTGK